MAKLDYSEDQINALVTSIYFGKINLKNLPVGFYKETAKTLNKAVSEGFGKELSSMQFGKPDFELLKQLTENIYIFSGAKTATMCEELSGMIVKDGEVLNLNEFKKAAKNRFNVYNGKDGYLESEYITANTAASSAANWEYTEENKELFPRLKSIVIMDKYTAPECARMNGVIADVSDPIWNHNISPRHFRCRCHEERIDKFDDVKSTHQSTVRKIERLNNESMQDVFKMNPGKDKIIFSDKHPYFEIGKKNPDLGKNNFGLPIPNKYK